MPTSERDRNSGSEAQPNRASSPAGHTAPGATHTPGPWRVVRNTGIVVAADCHVAKVGDFTDKQLLPFNRKRWEADADLIASAPSLASAASGMLSKLEALIEFVDDSLDGALGHGCDTVYVRGVSDVEITPDGSVKLSDARNAAKAARAAGIKSSSTGEKE